LFERIALPGTTGPLTKTLLGWHGWAQRLLAFVTLACFAVFLGVILAKTVFLGSDAAHHYAHVWYISDQIFHHARLPLHIQYLESGKALTFPYGIVPYVATAMPYAVLGDWSVTLAMVLGVVMYGYAAVRARPVLRDPRLLALVFLNTFLIEAILGFQFTWLWACVFFFLYVEAVDRRRWFLACLFVILAVTTHFVVGIAAVGLYGIYAFLRRPREVVPLGTALAVAALVCLPYLLYAHTTPSVSSTRVSYIIGTIKYMARFRSAIIFLPLIIAALAPLLKRLSIPAILSVAVLFGYRVQHQHVNLFGLNHDSHPFYGEFIKSPLFDRNLTYRLVEPNDQKDGAYQLIKNGAVLSQEFFNESLFRRWWYSLDMYSCYLGAKNVDMVIYESAYTWKFNQNEQWPLSEFLVSGKVKLVYTDPQGRFVVYDVRGARMPGAKLSECGF
jgi:hypothetical protein